MEKQNLKGWSTDRSDNKLRDRVNSYQEKIQNYELTLKSKKYNLKNPLNDTNNVVQSSQKNDHTFDSHLYNSPDKKTPDKKGSLHLSPQLKLCKLNLDNEIKINEHFQESKIQFDCGSNQQMSFGIEMSNDKQIDGINFLENKTISLLKDQRQQVKKCIFKIENQKEKIEGKLKQQIDKNKKLQDKVNQLQKQIQKFATKETVHKINGQNNRTIVNFQDKERIQKIVLEFDELRNNFLEIRDAFMSLTQVKNNSFEQLKQQIRGYILNQQSQRSINELQLHKLRQRQKIRQAQLNLLKSLTEKQKQIITQNQKQYECKLKQLKEKYDSSHLKSNQISHLKQVIQSKDGEIQKVKKLLINCRQTILNISQNNKCQAKRQKQLFNEMLQENKLLKRKLEEYQRYKKLPIR